MCLEPLLRGLGHADPGSLVQALQVPTIMFIMMRIVWLDYYLLGNTSQEKIDFLRALPEKGGGGIAQICLPFFRPCFPLYFDINIMLFDTFWSF